MHHREIEESRNRGIISAWSLDAQLDADYFQRIIN